MEVLSETLYSHLAIIVTGLALAVVGIIAYISLCRTSAVLGKGQACTLRLDGHKVVIRLKHISYESFHFHITVRLRGGSCWKYCPSICYWSLDALVFPQRNHPYTWHYQIIGSKIGKNKVKVSLRKK